VLSKPNFFLGKIPFDSIWLRDEKWYTENKIDFSASLEKDNYFGVQFHPEKSSVSGLKVLQNFIEYL